MKPGLSIRFAGMVATAACLVLNTAHAENTAAVNEVLKLKNAGVAEDTIVAFIQGKKINYDLSADSILSLRDKGITHALFNSTTIVNNHTVNRVVVGGETRAQLVNHGIDPSRLPSGKGRAFEPMRIQEMRTPMPGRAYERLDPRAKTLEVYRPGFNPHH